jgi:hypothetical protein
MKTKSRVWRCFFCDEVFRSIRSARIHFGNFDSSLPLCKIDAVYFRSIEKELADYRAEDSSLERQIRSLECKHQIELRRAEEQGYANGLRDSKQ